MDKPRTLIGRAEFVELPEFEGQKIPARIDTGAKTTSIWASSIKEKDGELSFCLFGKSSEFYTGKRFITRSYGKRIISSSTGHVQERYAIRTLVVLQERRIRATLTLANRSTQAYPLLVGRNVLRGKFIVDVKLGSPQLELERNRRKQRRRAAGQNRGKD